MFSLQVTGSNYHIFFSGDVPFWDCLPPTVRQEFGLIEADIPSSIIRLEEEAESESDLSTEEVSPQDSTDPISRPDLAHLAGFRLPGGGAL